MDASQSGAANELGLPTQVIVEQLMSDPFHNENESSRVADEDGQQELLVRLVQPEVAVQRSSKTPPNGRALRPNAVAARIRFWEM